MTQTNINNLSKLSYPEDLDFILEATGVAVLVEDIDRNVILTNTLFCNLFELNQSSTELINHPSVEYISTISELFIDKLQFENFFIETPKKGNMISNHTWRLANGKTLLQDYSPIYNNNTLKGHIWIFKGFQNSLLENHSNHNGIVENALHFINNPIAIFNTNLQILFANKAYVQNDEKRLWIKGKTLQQFFSYENLPQQIATARQENISKTIILKKSTVWYETCQTEDACYERICYPIFDATKKLTSVIEVANDISAQKKVEKKLQRAVEQFYNLANSVNTIVLQTNKTLQVEFVNNLWQEISGSTNNSASIGKSIFELLNVTNYDLYQKIFTILTGAATNKEGILALNDKDENLKQLSYNVQAGFNVNEEEGDGILLTLTDVTDKKMQESHLLELIKKEKELNQLKTAFVNMVSHELRTPLTVISSSAEILELMLKAGKNYEEVCIYTQQITDEVEKMTAFMQDLLMISKIEAGKISINLSNVNVVNFVQAIVNKSFNPWKDGRKATVIVKRKPENANVDTVNLEHSLVNILQNAFKYSVGKLSPIIHIGFSKTYYTISVIDDGIGIPEKDIPKLFTSFFRASNTGNISGTGIGLMVAKYFAEQHKGNISFKTKLNKGSIFTLKLPY